MQNKKNILIKRKLEQSGFGPSTCRVCGSVLTPKPCSFCHGSGGFNVYASSKEAKIADRTGGRMGRQTKIKCSYCGGRGERLVCPKCIK